MLPALRPHSPDPEGYAEGVASWESIVDGEEMGTERSAVRAACRGQQPRTIVAGLYAARLGAEESRKTS